MTKHTSTAGRTTDESLDWVIIGGGIHGVHLAVRLIAEAGVEPQRLRILDPAPRLLDSWQRCSTNTGMRYLRSPGVHHLDSDPWSLLRYAEEMESRKKSDTKLFAPPNSRPSVALFAEHSADVVARFGLEARHIKERATDIELSCSGVSVTLGDRSRLVADRVLLAMGAAAHTRWPTWANTLLAHGVRIHHIFQPGFNLDPDSWPERVAVIGGGISAAQTAIRLAQGSRQVHLISRHALRKHQFDSDPGWIGPKNMKRFKETEDLNERRRMINDARHVGSIPSDVRHELQRAIQRGTIHWHHGELTASATGTNTVIRIGMGSPMSPMAVLRVGASQLFVNAVLLATGFENQRPGGPLVDQLIESHTLPCADCGFPVIDQHLRWHPRVFVTGPLAELELGPVSRNIVGARRAAERIVPVAARA